MNGQTRRVGLWCGLSVLAAPLTLCSCAFLVGTTLLETPTCNYLSATCQYDPRSQQPNTMFIEQPPEPFVVQYIQDQVTQYGTFPPGATSHVVSVTPTLVTAAGFNSDWHVTAHVYIDVGYINGSVQQQIFNVMANGSRSLLFDDTMYASFGPLGQGQCQRHFVGTWSCW